MPAISRLSAEMVPGALERSNEVDGKQACLLQVGDQYGGVQLENSHQVIHAATHAEDVRLVKALSFCVEQCPQVFQILLNESHIAGFEPPTLRAF